MTTVSGIAPRRALVGILAETIHELGGRYDVSEILPQLLDWHWSAYAKIAGVRPPTATEKAEIIEVYRKYWVAA